MKHLKRFNETYKIVDNIVICDNLPKPTKEGEEQTMGFNPDQMVQGPDDSLSYGYTTSIDEISDDVSNKFISRHLKRFEDL